MTTTEVTAPGLCDWCRKGNHSGHRQGLDGICVGCSCSVVVERFEVNSDGLRVKVAAPIIGALGLNRMLLDPEAVEIEHTADGRVVVEWSAPRFGPDGRVVVDGDRVAELRMRSTFTVAHEELAEAVDHG